MRNRENLCLCVCGCVWVDACMCAWQVTIGHILDLCIHSLTRHTTSIHSPPTRQTRSLRAAESCCRSSPYPGADYTWCWCCSLLLLPPRTSQYRSGNRYSSQPVLLEPSSFIWGAKTDSVRTSVRKVWLWSRLSFRWPSLFKGQRSNSAPPI